MIAIMKKSIFLIFAAAGLVAMSACNPIDLEPKGMLDEATLFNSDYGVKKYLSAIYNDLPIEDFTYKAAGDGHKGYAVNNQEGYHRGNRWEALKGYSSTITAETAGRGNQDTAGAFGYWPYAMIRNINTFINNLPQYKDNFDEATFNDYLGEGHFLRAYYYFGLAKRYGGVPIIAEAQDPTADIESLKVPRATEYDTWKFIHDDLQFAIDNMKDRNTPYGRASRYAAAALMSKAMLFAGSVAKYNGSVGITGEATEKGLMGMDPSYAEEFFKYAYDACKLIEGSGYFSLHDGADKEKAYTEVFIEQTSEDIFVKLYGNKETTPWNMSLNHCWDALTLPSSPGMSTFVGGVIWPTWDLVGLYEHPAIVAEDGTPVRFNSLSEFWDTEEMEPRCRANFFFSGMTEPVTKTVINTQAGVYSSFNLRADDPQVTPDTNVETDYTKANRKMASRPGQVEDFAGYKAVQINGLQGVATGVGDEGYTSTGMIIRKYMNYNATTEQRGIFLSEQSYKVFRYGEILMNLAEAAYELGLETNNPALKAEAFNYVNQIRSRAGAHPHEMVADPVDVGSELYGYELDENLLYIRQERQRELCLENQTQWDQRRWRIAHSIFANGYLPKVLFGYKVLAEDKYIFLNEAERFGRRLTFDKRSYYEQIPGGEINKNDKLIRNDGY